MRRIGITIGDPSGIGPEVSLKALAQLSDRDWQAVLIGPVEIWERTNSEIDLNLELIPVDSVSDANDDPAQIPILNTTSPISVEEIKIGEITPECGQIAFKAIELAIQLCQSDELDGICTAPIHKAALQKAGYLFPGHTEILQTFTQSKIVAMCLVGGGLRAVPLTNHAALKNVPARVTEDSVFDMIKLLSKEIKRFGVEEPRIGVCGLNPHAGDAGAIGTEDLAVIQPAIAKAVKKGIQAIGPIPADIIFRQMLHGKYDVILAMYHDQALIPIKTLDFDNGVNITLGLPFIRTSPDHGTAHDLAGKNIARPESMVSALNLANQLIKNR